MSKISLIVLFVVILLNVGFLNYMLFVKEDTQPVQRVEVVQPKPQMVQQQGHDDHHDHGGDSGHSHDNEPEEVQTAAQPALQQQPVIDDHPEETPPHAHKEPDFGFAMSYDTEKKFSSKEVFYKDKEGKEFMGYWFPAKCDKTNRPVILVAPRWRGIGDHELEQSRKLSEECYNVLAFDVYDTSTSVEYTAQARMESKKFSEDKTLVAKRVRAAYDYISTVNGVDKSRVAVIGYTFGGWVAIDAAMQRETRDIIDAAVAFHSPIRAMRNARPEILTNPMLYHHGKEDNSRRPGRLEHLSDLLSKTDTNPQSKVIEYSGAGVSFAVENEIDDPTGLNFNPVAEKEAWKNTLEFLRDVFGEGTPAAAE